MRKLPGLSAVLKRRARRHLAETKHQQPMSVEANEGVPEAELGQEIGLITRLVGCSHREMGRPFREGNVKYRSCLKCGARRQFDEKTFETFGKFYLPPVPTKNL